MTALTLWNSFAIMNGLRWARPTLRRLCTYTTLFTRGINSYSCAHAVILTAMYVCRYSYFDVLPSRNDTQRAVNGTLYFYLGRMLHKLQPTVQYVCIFGYSHVTKWQIYKFSFDTFYRINYVINYTKDYLHHSLFAQIRKISVFFLQF